MISLSKHRSSHSHLSTSVLCPKAAEAYSCVFVFMCRCDVRAFGILMLLNALPRSLLRLDKLSAYLVPEDVVLGRIYYHWGHFFFLCFAGMFNTPCNEYFVKTQPK